MPYYKWRGDSCGDFVLADRVLPFTRLRRRATRIARWPRSAPVCRAAGRAPSPTYHATCTAAERGSSGQALVSTCIARSLSSGGGGRRAEALSRFWTETETETESKLNASWPPSRHGNKTHNLYPVGAFSAAVWVPRAEMLGGQPYRALLRQGHAGLRRDASCLSSCLGSRPARRLRGTLSALKVDGAA